MTTAQALRETLISPNVPDRNLEPANVVDVLAAVSVSLHQISNAITPVAIPGTDAGGGHVECLTEAVMGITGGLHAIADAINRKTEQEAWRRDHG